MELYSGSSHFNYIIKTNPSLLTFLLNLYSSSLLDTRVKDTSGVGHKGGTILNYFLIILAIVILMYCNFTNKIKTYRVVEYFKRLKLISVTKPQGPLNSLTISNPLTETGVTGAMYFNQDPFLVLIVK